MAMNVKHLNIKIRFLFQILLFILYVAISVLLVLRLNNVYRLNSASFQRLISAGDLLTESQVAYKSFLNSIRADESFFQDGENEYTLRFKNSTSAIMDSVNNISDKKRLMNKLSASGKTDTLHSVIQLYTTNFTQIMLALKELGNNNHGATSLIRTSSENLLNALKQSGIPELVNAGIKIKDLEASFIQTGNHVSYSELRDLLEGIGNLSVNPETDFLLLEEINGMAQDYLDKINHVESIYDRLGTVDLLNSLYGDMAASYNNLRSDLGQVTREWKMISGQNLRLNIIFVSILFLILTLLYIGSVLRQLKVIRDPLKLSTEFSYKIAKGQMNLTPLDTACAGEIADLNRNLNGIFTFITEKKNFVEDLLKQKFKADLNLQGKHDTFGKTLLALKENMRKARDEQDRYSAENTLRRYQNEGIAKFSDILRNNSDNLDRLADIFIKELVGYFEAIQGGLFLLDEENSDTLELKAAFAYNRKKYLNKTIKTGEGLVGTCALEMKSINLTDIPEDYIEITSGLGDAPPNNLLLLPIMHEGVLIGVLEIASLKTFDANQLSLGEKISDSLASSIINARANSKTAELLQKSQQQAAEMAEQEEEMRQNMEELKATQEESARREEELEGLLSAIDQSFYVVEYDIEGTITKVNQRFLYLLNLKSDKVLGMKHAELFGKKSRADNLLFASVAEGKTVELVEKVEINKKMLEIKNTFSPVRLKDGKTIKILNIMTLNM